MDFASFNSFEHNFLVLPTGQIMDFTIDGPTVQIYAPAGSPNPSWAPVITSVPSSLDPGQTFTLSGTQLNGLSEGAYYGDDTNASTNFPLVRITNNATSHVFYARTFNHSSRSIAPGAASSTSFTVTALVESGASTVVVVANGIPSAPVAVTISSEPALVVTSAAQINVSGAPGGSFSPSSFIYQLSATHGTVNYSISGAPTWLTASSTSGTVGAVAKNITFTVNASANTLGGGIYGPTTITFTNTSNGVGTVIRTATLNVSNDNFSAAIPIQAGQILLGSNVGASKEIGEPNLVASSGGKSVWWKFTAPAAVTFNVNTIGSSFDTILGIFTGSSVGALTKIIEDDDSGGNNTSSASFSAAAGTTYYLMVDGFSAASGNIQIQVTAGTSLALDVTPASDIATSGSQGGPFAPASFQYQLSSSTGSVNYLISGLPTWLTASSASGTVTTSSTVVTFTINSNANSLSPATYNGSVTFTNTTNGQGTQTRNATLTVSAPPIATTSLKTYVAAKTGTDTGLCPITAPCASLNYALSVTSSGGQVTVLSAGVFGPIILTQPVIIEGAKADSVQIFADPAVQVGCVGVSPASCGLTNNGFAVEIAAGASDSVKLSKVLVGAGNSGGAGALKLSAGGTVQLSENVYRGNDTQTGPIIALYPNNPGTTQTQVYFSNSDVGFNNNGANAGAVEVKPSGNTSLKLHFNHVEVHNASYGIRTDSSLLSSPSVNVATAISESEFFSFANAAVNAFSLAGTGTTNAAFDAVRILNASVAIRANGPLSTVILTNSTISGNGTGVQVLNSAHVYTPQNNTIFGNGADLSGSLSSSPLR